MIMKQAWEIEEEKLEPPRLISPKQIVSAEKLTFRGNASKLDSLESFEEV